MTRKITIETKSERFQKPVGSTEEVVEEADEMPSTVREEGEGGHPITHREAKLAGSDTFSSAALAF